MSELQKNSKHTYDRGLDYMDCLQAILITKRKKKSEAQIRKEFPLFSRKFSDMVSAIYAKNITVNDVLRTKQPTFDHGKTFAQCVYALLKESAAFDARAKHEDQEGLLSEWVAWFENMMRTWPKFDEFFRVLMRSICEGRAQCNSVTTILIASIDMQMRGRLSVQERQEIFSQYLARKGVYTNQINALQITQQEWYQHIKDYFEKVQPKADS